MNWYILFISAAIPLVTGFIWYNKNVFGNAWTKASGINPDDGTKMNMVKLFGLTYLLGLFFSGAMLSMVIHQMHVGSIFADVPDANQPGSDFMLFMEKYGDKFKTFKHGAFHGFIGSITVALPIIGIIAMFERRSGKYIFIHWGYWAITMMLMGGLICGCF